MQSIQQFGLLVDQEVSESKRAAIKEHVDSALKDNSGPVRFLSFKFDDEAEVYGDIEVREAVQMRMKYFLLRRRR